MEVILNTCGAFFLVVGSFFCISGGVGLLRFPDFYTRMHAVGVTDTLGASMILIGLMFYSTDFLILAKLVMILLFTFLLGPTTSHVLAKAAMYNGLTPTLAHNNNVKETSSSNS
ncbi:MAG: monovalent cation/H(+) antiporter subunit G [Cognaticolwellia sp.]